MKARETLMYTSFYTSFHLSLLDHNCEVESGVSACCCAVCVNVLCLH